MKVLHVIGYIGKGGDTTAVQNVQEYIQKKNIDIKFDYVTHEGADVNRIRNLKEYGSKVHIISGDVRKIGVIKYYKEFSKIVRDNTYDCIHFHTSFQSCLGLYIAKKNKVSIRICHSHTSEVQRKCGKWTKKIILPICRILIRKLSTKCVACSKEAAQNLFDKKCKYEIIYNGLNIEKLRDISDESVEKLKQKLNIKQNTKVIGQVGRFSLMKNPEYMINIAKKMKESQYMFIFLGTGELLDNIKEMASDLTNVKFMGKVDNVGEFMKIFNYLLVPSKYGEGLPVVLIEQQIINPDCICIANDNIAKEANLGNVIYKNIDNTDEWCNIIKSGRKGTSVNTDKFNIKNTVSKWIQLYNK